MAQRKSPENDQTAKIKESVADRISPAIPSEDIRFKGGPWVTGFWAVIAAFFLFFGWLGTQSGINGDEDVQVQYAQDMMKWYATMGEDTSCYTSPKGPIKYYGALFELTTHLTSKTLGITPDDASYHTVRHLWNSVFGWVALLFTGLILWALAGPRAGIAGVLLLGLTPLFAGHAAMNPKDIPFTAGFVMSLYGVLRLFQRWESPGRWPMVFIALGIGIAFGTRAGAILFMLYVLFFGVLDLHWRYGIGALFSQAGVFKKYFVRVALPVVAGYAIGLLAWPYALASPIAHPLEALNSFAKFLVGIRILYMGDNIMSDQLPWHYPFNWMLRTLPLSILIGTVTGLLVSPFLHKRFGKLPVFIFVFTSIFPVVYVVLKHSNLYDGWRHLMFVLPSMIILAVLAAVYLVEKTKPAVGIGMAVVAGLLSISPALFIVRNPFAPYVWFNEVQGGLKGALGNMETDYWGVTVKQAFDWLENTGKIGPAMKDTVDISTNFYYASKEYAKKYNGKVRVRYLKYANRYDYPWDYAIYPSRFNDGSYIRLGHWPPKPTIHTIDANGVPLMAILENKQPSLFTAIAAAKKNDWATALPLLAKAHQEDPGNEIALLNLSQGYLTIDSAATALNYIRKGIDVNPDEVSFQNLLGSYYLRTNDVENAKNTFQKSIEMEPKNAVGYYYLAIIEQSTQHLDSAIEYMQKGLELVPSFKPGYELMATLYQLQGRSDLANQYRAMGAQVR